MVWVHRAQVMRKMRGESLAARDCAKQAICRLKGVKGLKNLLRLKHGLTPGKVIGEHRA